MPHKYATDRGLICCGNIIMQEEVVTITMNKYRKGQQMVEEAERRADTAERNITIVRGGVYQCWKWAGQPIYVSHERNNSGCQSLNSKYVQRIGMQPCVNLFRVS